MKRNQKAWISGIIAALASLIFGFFFYKSLAPTHLFHERTDLLICVNAARNLWQGLPVYKVSDLWAHTKPPFATLFFIPLTFLSEGFLLQFWDLLNFGVLFYLAFVFSRESKTYFPHVNAFYLGLVSIFGIMNFWGYELRFGQYNLLGLFALWIAGQTQSISFSAALFFFAFFLKPSNLLFLPWILKKQNNNRKFIISSITFGFALCILYSSLFGISRVITDHIEWLQFMKIATDKYLMREVNYGLPLFFGYFTSATWPHHVLLLSGLLFGFYWAKKDLHSLKIFGGLSALSLMVSPMTWWATFTLLMPLSTYLCAQAFDALQNSNRSLALRNLGLVTLGTQLIYVPTLGPLAHYYRLANPNWIYLFYIVWETLRKPQLGEGKVST